MNDKEFPVLSTDRLILQQFNLTDSAEVQRMAGDKDVAVNTLNIPHPYLDGMAETWIQSQESDFQTDKSLVFAICLKENGKLAGAIGLNLQLNFELAELGYWIGKEYWNNGYCTEAAGRIIEFAFNHYKLHKIYATHFTNNPASGKVMEKAGMHLEGTLREHLFHWGEYKNLNYYCIFKELNKI